MLQGATTSDWLLTEGITVVASRPRVASFRLNMVLKRSDEARRADRLVCGGVRC